MKPDQIQRIGYLLNRINGITERTDRKRLATIYEIVLAVPSFFPRPGLSFRRSNSAGLRRKVCNHCPSAMRPAQMKQLVETVRKQLKEYSAKLKAIVGEEGQPPSEPISVHDLDSTI